MIKTERLNLLIYGANVVFLVFALSVLVWLKDRFEADAESTVAKTSALFPRSILGDPDNLHVTFAAWEGRARIMLDSQSINRLILSKAVQGPLGRTREMVVYPFYYAAKHGSASPGRETGLRREDLSDAEGVYGWLYLDLNLASLNSVRVAIWTLAVLLALALGILTSRLWSQERSLTQTSVELEEKHRQLIRLERLALAGQLTANIFHDIKKPILNIRHELDDLGETLGNFAGASKGLHQIREHVDLFFAMLRDLGLERFVQAVDGEAEYVELPKVIEQACRLVRYERGGTKLEIQCDEGLPLILAPPYRLIQVFSNLALNAYQAMRGKGELRIAVRRVEGLVETRIADSGPGISPLHLPHVFTPFFSTKDRGDGAGLGLYISRQIVEEMGGDVRVDSKEGVGTEFRVTLPAAAPGRQDTA
jgi:signal transduction histidine kinase